ncbi:MAG: hypothetical protein IKN63_04675 [Bacilli bacterium]|nr:hypothetical protein [Bacilli bacterium]
MKRRVDPVAIGSVAVDVSKKQDALMEATNKLKKDINSIRTYYQGNDAELIIEKYLKRLEIINDLMDNYNNIKQYFVTVSSGYSDNLNNAKKNLNDAKSQSKSKTNLSKKTIKIDSKGK